MNLDRAAVRAAVRHACELDVKAQKPGNVSMDSPAFGMTAADFFASAAAISEPITDPKLTVGERIYRAVEATQRVVNCNTNLGIVLLLAPIICAQELAARDGTSLEPSLFAVLTHLTQADADWTYRAIRLAKPGGMGTSAKHDIAAPPTVTLLQAMQEAMDRDQIARLYVTGYARLFQRNIAVWRKSLARWSSQEWAMTALFVNLLGEENDSLIIRKFGKDIARRVSANAKLHAQAIDAAHDFNPVLARLSAWDAELKQAGINPGTTADLCVTSVFVAALLDHA